MELKELLGDELFSQIDAKTQEHNRGIEDKLRQVRFVDLSDGGYVRKERYQELNTKIGVLETQLKDANTTIKPYCE
ncbi:MAG TPA: hypothetical protein H9858_03845 [Candidatus Blautia stercoravium]|nr:hypothetical protein [Candidatus Blautia stercoravium]